MVWCRISNNLLSKSMLTQFSNVYVPQHGDELTPPPLTQCRIYASVNRVYIDSDNGLSPIRRQAIFSTNAGLLSIRPLGTNFSEILIKIQNFSFTKMHLKITSAKWRPFCPGRDELMASYVCTAVLSVTSTNAAWFLKTWTANERMMRQRVVYTIK